MQQEEYERIVNEFKREAGKLISKVYSMYGYKDLSPEVTDHLTGLCEQAIREVEKYYARFNKVSNG